MVVYKFKETHLLSWYKEHSFFCRSYRLNYISHAENLVQAPMNIVVVTEDDFQCMHVYRLHCFIKGAYGSQCRPRQISYFHFLGNQLGIFSLARFFPEGAGHAYFPNFHYHFPNFLSCNQMAEMNCLAFNGIVCVTKVAIYEHVVLEKVVIFLCTWPGELLFCKKCGRHTRTVL